MTKEPSGRDLEHLSNAKRNLKMDLNTQSGGLESDLVQLCIIRKGEERDKSHWEHAGAC